jgi:hypothetical protein
MSIEAAIPGSETVADGRAGFVDVFAFLLGSVVVFAGAFVLFAASPVVSVDPVFTVSSFEPIAVVSNMAVGASIMTAGAGMSVSKLEYLL